VGGSEPESDIGTAITWILPSTPTGDQAATYSVTISGILNANHQPLPDISYTTTTFVPTPTTATLTSQVEFLAPTNQTASGSKTSTVTLARSLNVAAPLSVVVQGNGVSQEVEFAAGQAYATAILPVGSFTLTDPQGGVIAPGGGTTQVVPWSGGGGGGATSSVIFTGEMRYHPSSARKTRHPKVQFELTFSAPINRAPTSIRVSIPCRTRSRGRGNDAPRAWSGSPSRSRPDRAARACSLPRRHHLPRGYRR
jgi:hypothetical protein